MQKKLYLVWVSLGGNAQMLDSVHVQAVGRGKTYEKVGALKRMRELNCMGLNSRLEVITAGEPITTNRDVR